ncbi:4-coumarate--CoA ligase [Loktanella fryxellensis]|uniref:4-coumarate--CoA ligase n=1 Tax=Loktanella fryxellensis TaxID=245187 RepID=A0A1H8D4K5_9RHOB|nr:AMP-binding protein [Loktanella fryxellensis]SEN02095.1 4-coumarate--CoA ligase [Loktanella fryxellensis]
MTIFTSPFPDIAQPDISITDRVFQGLRPRPDEVVLTDGPTGRTLTAAQFMDQVERLAGGLTARGLGAGQTIALMGPNCPEYCVVFHAVAFAGGTITTINPTYTAAEVRHQLQDSRATFLVTVPACLEIACDGITGTDVTGLALIGAADGDTPDLASLMGDPLTRQVPVDLDAHTVVLPYSSGTTGLPKGVMLSHRNLVVNVDQIITGAGFAKGEVAAAFLPFFHIYGMTVLMNVHLAGGGALVTMPRFDLEMFLRISQDHRSVRMWIVPPVALALAKHPLVDNFDLSALQQIFSGAAPLGAELSNAVGRRLNCVSLQGYGMTELSPVSHLSPIDNAKAGASGLAAPNVQCRIVDIETGTDLGAGAEGELWIKGPNVMQGYLNNSAATTATIVDGGWLRTGDIARIDPDGQMHIVDRLKELIKYKGFQVAPAELEAALTAMDGITDAAVIGLPDPEAGELPMAFVVRTADGPDADAIKAHLATTLAHYKQLHRIEVVDTIPKSASGKILRRLLRDQLKAVR